MSDITGEMTLYTTLEVSESATDAEIQQAYFRLIRLYPPQQDHERYQRLNEARETLLDPQRRGEYDQGRRSGNRVRVLLDQAALAMEKDPQKSLSLLKSAVTLAPDLPRPRNLLAQLLIRTKNYDVAERQYLWLIRRTPNNETLRCKLARCLILQGKYDEAEQELKAVMALNEAHYDAQLLLARIYRTQNRIQELIDALEQAIAADEQETFADFSALLQLLMVYIQIENHDASQQTAQRLLEVIPEEHYGQATDAIIQTAELFFREDHFLWARQLLLHLQDLPIVAEDPRSLKIQQLLQKSRIQHEALQMDSDSLLHEGLRNCFRTLYRDHTSENIRDTRMNAALINVQKEVEQNPRAFLKQITYLSREYPLISEEQEKFLKVLSQRGLNRLAQLEAQQSPQVLQPPPSAPPPASEEPHRGGLFGRFLGAR